MNARRLYLLFAAIALCLALTACAPAQMPSYLVRITPAIPFGNGLCSGAILSPHEVLTAKHCVASARRILTAYGQEAWVQGARVSETHDVAILYTESVLWTQEFAALGKPEVGQPVTLWGVCSFYFAHVPRYALYNGLFTERTEDGTETDYGWFVMLPAPGNSNKACGGDSGGFALQGNRVVGVTSALYSEYWFAKIGVNVFMVPTEYATELLEVAQSE